MPNLKKIARRFQILADPIRLHIILLLQDNEQCVGELCEILNQSQPKVSYHLRLMLEAGVIKQRCSGTWSYYSLTTDIRKWINKECGRFLDCQELLG